MMSIAVPLATTLTTVMVFGMLLLIGGAAEIDSAFWVHRWSGFFPRSAWWRFAFGRWRHYAGPPRFGCNGIHVDDFRILNGWRAHSNPSVWITAIPEVGLDDAQWNHNNGDGNPDLARFARIQLVVDWNIYWNQLGF
jgi:hypothetical protein